MSRIGKAPIAIPAGVTVQVNNDVVTVKGPKGELSQKFNPELEIKVEDGQLTIARPSDARDHRAQHGLYRALINNMVVGVSTGYRKEMELVGVGYRASAEGQVLELSLGFSHAIYIKLPKEVKVEAKLRETRTLSSSLKVATSNFSVKCVQKFVHSASPNLTKVKVSSLLVKSFAASLVNRLVLSN